MRVSKGLARVLPDMAAKQFRDIDIDVGEKVPKVSTATENNFAVFDDSGAIKDEGKEIPDGDVAGTSDDQVLTQKDITLKGATDQLGSASITDESTTQADPASLTSTAISGSDADTVASSDPTSASSSDADTVTGSDAGASYTAAEQGLINEIKSDYNAAVTLINELKTNYNDIAFTVTEIKTDYNSMVALINEIKGDYTALRADVTAIRSAVTGTIDYCDALKTKLNGLLAELRKTDGCGVLAD